MPSYGGWVPLKLASTYGPGTSYLPRPTRERGASIHPVSDRSHSRKHARAREGTQTKSYSYNAGGGSFSTHQ